MNLLLAEDDPLLADALCAQMRRAGFTVEHAPNGAVAEYLLMRQSFDAAVLDIGLPMLDGLSVLARVRVARPALPVLLLTARDGLEDRVAGLNAGADDYLTKPFDFAELEARLNALLRRARLVGAPRGGQQLGQLVLEPEARRALVNEVALELSPREWVLLELLMAHRERVVTKEQILQIWGQEAGASNAIEVYIHRLRKKLEGAGVAVRTVRGLGYLLEAA
ncbi:MAG: response regulator transcription factor [Burkholderiales bacterium]|jgi:two-component system OmpR family response regulator